MTNPSPDTVYTDRQYISDYNFDPIKYFEFYDHYEEDIGQNVNHIIEKDQEQFRIIRFTVSPYQKDTDKKDRIFYAYYTRLTKQDYIDLKDYCPCRQCTAKWYDLVSRFSPAITFGFGCLKTSFENAETVYKARKYLGK